MATYFCNALRQNGCQLIYEENFRQVQLEGLIGIDWGRANAAENYRGTIAKVSFQSSIWLDLDAPRYFHPLNISR
jgi:hypothetical protein